MNRREKTVVALLVAAFVVGAGIALIRRAQFVRERRDTPLTVSVAAPAPVQGQLLDLNTATAGQLEALPGIGQVLALRIVDFRSENGGFKNVGQLKRVTGIGPKRYAVLKRLVSVSVVVDSGP